MTHCGFGYEVHDEARSCPRQAVDGRERCPFHLTPAERDAAGVGRGALRAAFVDDLYASDPRRREYVGVSIRDLNLFELVVDGGDVGRIAFRDLSVRGTLDLSGSVWRHIDDALIGQVDATDAAFEMDHDCRSIGTSNPREART